MCNGRIGILAHICRYSLVSVLLILLLLSWMLPTLCIAFCIKDYWNARWNAATDGARIECWWEGCVYAKDCFSVYYYGAVEPSKIWVNMTGVKLGKSFARRLVPQPIIGNQRSFSWTSRWIVWKSTGVVITGEFTYDYEDVLPWCNFYSYESMIDEKKHNQSSENILKTTIIKIYNKWNVLFKSDDNLT